MREIFLLTLKSALRDTYLFFWSLVIPICGTLALGYFITIDNYAENILTGMSATSVLFYAFMTTTFSILGQRRRGVYNLLRITPLSLYKYIISVSSAWTFISTICSIIVLAIGIVFFKLNVNFISLLLCLPVIFIASTSYIFMSFCISRFCKNEGHASMLCNLITMPLLFCSNAFYSLQNAPTILRAISNFNPFEYLVIGLRTSLNIDISQYIISILVLGGIFIISLLLAVKSFRFNDVA